MKEYLPIATAILAAGFFFGEVHKAAANVYASQLKITNPDDSPFDGNFSDGTGAKISFFLNDTANVVTIIVRDAADGGLVTQIDGGAMSSGLNSVEWDGTGAEAGRQYTYEITAQQPTASATDWTVFFDSDDIEIFTRGVAVVKDMTSHMFGLIYAPNTGGDAPQVGKGITIYNPDGSFHDPFLVAADINDGGTVDWGGGSDVMYGAVFDNLDRFYVSAIQFGEIRRLDQDHSIRAVITGLTNPKGLYLEGEGEALTIYVAADNKIWRGNIGTADSMNAVGMELLAQFSGFFPHQINLDDEGSLYVSLRTTNLLGSDGKGIRKYDITGTLPVTDDDALWFLGEEKTFIANDLVFDRGSDGNSAVDDILYFVTRAGEDRNEDGIWRVDDINSFFPDVVRIITEDDLYFFSDSNVQARATFDFDAAGNIIFMENANEHLFFISPPSLAGTNSFTTMSPDTFMVDAAVSVSDPSEALLPNSYRLEQNYPNPFNPSTSIKFHLKKAEPVSILVYDLKGRLIKTLIDREDRAEGAHTVEWDGTDNFGQRVASGRYVYTLEFEEFRQSRVMTLSK